MVLKTDRFGLRFGPLTASCRHLCVDMQKLFAAPSDWALDWLPRVLPNVVRLCEHRPDGTVFTRFIPPDRPEEATGSWRRYYRRWEAMTRSRLEAGMVDLVPELARFVPPATVVDKATYSPWLGSDLHDRLQRGGVDTLLVSGGETDVCVLATVLGAVDLGYRVVLVVDGLCSASDETHDALIGVYHRRFGQQVETVDTEGALAAWT